MNCKKCGGDFVRGYFVRGDSRGIQYRELHEVCDFCAEAAQKLKGNVEGNSQQAGVQPKIVARCETCKSWYCLVAADSGVMGWCSAMRGLAFASAGETCTAHSQKFFEGSRLDYSLDYYLNLNYRIILENSSEFDTYTAFIPELGKLACYGVGKNFLEALSMLESVKTELLTYYYDNGIPIPLPSKRDGVE